MSSYPRRYLTASPPELSYSSGTGIFTVPELAYYTKKFGGAAYIGTYRFLNPRVFNVSGSLWTVPSGTVYIYAKCWGSGARGGNFPNGSPDGDGGAGGYAEAVIPVTVGEQLYVGVGEVLNNGGATKSFGGAGGGLSGIFKGSTTATWGGFTWPLPLIIAGGGGGGAVNTTAQGGAGGGANGQAGSDNVMAGATQTAAGTNNTASINGIDGGGGGYYGGGGGTYFYASSGGSGYVNATGNLHKTYTTGNYRTPPNTTDLDYPSGNSPLGKPYAYGGIGADISDNTHGSGAVIIHILGGGYDPANLPTIPTTRTVLDSF